jgi:hypothetical protein
MGFGLDFVRFEREKILSVDWYRLSLTDFCDKDIQNILQLGDVLNAEEGEK